MGRINGHTVEEVIAAVHKCHGILAATAKELKVTRQTVYRYVKTYATVADAVDNERQEWIDMAEQELIKQIMKGNIQAIMFFLKTVGKTRGYVERQEITGADGASIKIEWGDNGTGNNPG